MVFIRVDVMWLGKCALANVHVHQSQYVHVQEENTRALVFYLEHAKNARLEFPVAIDKHENTKMLRYFMIFHILFVVSLFIIIIIFCVRPLPFPVIF